jgi:predicted MFS family arabinose efflux permease
MMQNKGTPWIMLASIYITQYIGVAFIMSAAMAILRQQGVALDKLALLNLAALPMIGKIFYAPLIDKYRPHFQGQYRSWLLIAQGSMTFMLFTAGLMDLQQHFNWLFLILAIYVFFMSIQDVSVDGLSCKLFDADSRKMASSIQFSGNLTGNIIGGGLILMFYPWLHWHGSLWLLAALTFFSLLQIVFFCEPEQNAHSAAQTTVNKRLLADAWDFIKQKKHWFIVMTLYPIGSTCGFALLNPLLVDSGWSLDDIGFALKIYGSGIGLVSALIATPVITYFGRMKALMIMSCLQAIALLFIVPLTLGYTDKLTVYLALTVHFISFPALLVISATIMMDNAANQERKATFFTLQFSFAALMGFIYSYISMALAKYIGYSAVVMSGVLVAFVITFFIWLLEQSKAKTAVHCETEREAQHST